MVSGKAALHQRLRQREFLTGAFVSAPSPELVEIAALSNFDFAVLDAEHGPFAIGEITHLVRAGQAVNLPVLVRVPEPTKEFILRALDAGSAGIIAPQIESADDARVFVAQTRYPPEGVRGAAFYARAHGFSARSGDDIIATANREVVAGALIESPRGVANAAEISAVPGVDFILVGPTDLAVNIGGPDAQKKVSDAVAVLPGIVGATIPIAIGAPDPAAAEKFRAQGYSVIVTGLLPLLLRQARLYVSGCRGPVMTGRAS